MSQPGTDRADDAPLRDASSGHALIVTGERGPSASRGEARRPDAAFVTQILASKAHMGPFRRYRREEPSIAMARYAAAAALADETPALKRSA
jgi:hypothetical protein